MADSNDIQHSILDMQSKRSKLGIKKQQIQAKINEKKQMLQYVKEGETYDELVAAKRELVSESHEIDAQLSQLKQDIKKRQLLKDEVKANETPNTLPVKSELTVQRDYYLKFAGDKTRVSSMRAMAAEFAESLTKIIKKI
ncbi:hypothetical protein [Pedobacter sp. B4-66]|uniref:hypothetical protein n=1 Tax=Pedobacter sp. B4-66 TaxID=2817280 RepID=UPI001BDA13AF|nr:hypothetical protein [Pedobacter sp. B4-66]